MAKPIPTGRNFVRLGLDAAESAVLFQMLEHYITTHGDLSVLGIADRLNDAVDRVTADTDPDELVDVLKEQMLALAAEVEELFEQKTGQTIDAYKAANPVEDKRLDDYLKSMDSDGAL